MYNPPVANLHCPVTFKLSFTVTSEVAFPIEIGTVAVPVPITIPPIVSVVFNDIIPSLSKSNTPPLISINVAAFSRSVWSASSNNLPSASE